MEMACCDDEITLDSLIDLAIWLDNMLQDCEPKARPILSACSAVSEPMELGNAQVSTT